MKPKGLLTGALSLLLLLSPCVCYAEMGSSGSLDSGSASAAPVKQVPVVEYLTHSASIGWMPQSVESGAVAGTVGRGLQVEALKVSVPAYGAGAVDVQAHVSGIGWQGESLFSTQGYAGTTGKAAGIEAVRISLSDELSADYSIWYQVHCSDYGWLGWAHDGEDAGSTGYAKHVEAIRITILPKGEVPSDYDAYAEKTCCKNRSDEAPRISAEAHISSYGWQPAVYFGSDTDRSLIAGTTGRSIGIEAVNVKLDWYGHDGYVESRAHVSGIGWQPWTRGVAGTTGQAKTVEALQFRLKGEVAQDYTLWYRVHSSGIGWLDWTSDGAPAGTTGQSKSIEAVQFALLPKGESAPGSTDRAYVGGYEKLAARSQTVNLATSSYASAASTVIGKEGGKGLHSVSLSLDNQIVDGSISYRTLSMFQEDWSASWSSDGAWSNGQNDGKLIKAIQIRLSGAVESKYDVWYRAYDSERGWLGWAKNGENCGVTHGSSSLTAIQVSLLNKGGDAPGSCDGAFLTDPAPASVVYQAHIANNGWQAPVADGETAGTTGKSLSLQALNAFVDEDVNAPLSIEVHLAGIGWQSANPSGVYAGTVGQNRGIQAVKMSLPDSYSQQYDLYYRVHSAQYGWLGWAKNGEVAGTTGLALDIQAVQIKLVAKNSSDAPAQTEKAYVSAPVVSLKAHVSGIGWMNPVRNGDVAGTTGQGKAVEALNLSVSQDGYDLGARVSAHVSGIGWMNPVGNGADAGTTGQSKQMEALKVELTGTDSKYFDVWYRAHVQGYGWLGWTSNGSVAGTTDIGYRLEAVQIKVLPKGSAAPGSTDRPWTNRKIVNLPPEQQVLLNRARWYASATPWLIMVDTSACRVGIYNGYQGNWEQVQYWVCAPGKPSTPTVRGQFTVASRGYVFGHGYSCYYWTQFYGDYLFHSVLYNQGTRVIQDGRLGAQLSHGCVRLAIENAEWIYRVIPSGTKVVVF